MFKEYGRVKVKATGMYGTIVDWRPDSDHCEVELDGWQRNALPDEDDLLLRTFSLSDLDELVEVSNAERKAVFRKFRHAGHFGLSAAFCSETVCHCDQA